jgi:hypothetical protein
MEIQCHNVSASKTDEADVRNVHEVSRAAKLLVRCRWDPELRKGIFMAPLGFGSIFEHVYLVKRRACT